MKLAFGIKQVNGAVRFEVSAPGLAPFVVIGSRVEEKQNANAPDWILFHDGERCGGLWKTLPRNGGDEYLAGNLESPIFPGGKIRVAVFRSKNEDRKGQLDMTWQPPRDGEGGGNASAGYSAPAASGGYQSAPAAPAGDDDDIPF